MMDLSYFKLSATLQKQKMQILAGTLLPICR